MDLNELKFFFEELDVKNVDVRDIYTDTGKAGLLTVSLLKPISITLTSVHGITNFICDTIDYQRKVLTFINDNKCIVELPLNSIINIDTEVIQ